MCCWLLTKMSNRFPTPAVILKESFCIEWTWRYFFQLILDTDHINLLNIRVKIHIILCPIKSPSLLYTWSQTSNKSLYVSVINGSQCQFRINTLDVLWSYYFLLMLKGYNFIHAYFSYNIFISVNVRFLCFLMNDLSMRFLCLLMSTLDVRLWFLCRHRASVSNGF